MAEKLRAFPGGSQYSTTTMDVNSLLCKTPEQEIPFFLYNAPTPQPLLRLPSEIPDSQESQEESSPNLTSLSQPNTHSWDSWNGLRPLNLPPPPPPPPRTPTKQKACHTSRSDRIRIKTALQFNVPIDQISSKLG